MKQHNLLVLLCVIILFTLSIVLFRQYIPFVSNDSLQELATNLNMPSSFLSSISGNSNGPLKSCSNTKITISSSSTPPSHLKRNVILIGTSLASFCLVIFLSRILENQSFNMMTAKEKVPISNSLLNSIFKHKEIILPLPLFIFLTFLIFTQFFFSFQTDVVVPNSVQEKEFYRIINEKFVKFIYNLSDPEIVTMAELFSLELPPKDSFSLKTLLRQSEHVPFLFKKIKFKVLEIIVTNRNQDSFYELLGIFYKHNWPPVTLFLSNMTIKLPTTNISNDKQIFTKHVNDTFNRHLQANTISPSLAEFYLNSSSRVESELVTWISQLLPSEKLNFTNLFLASLSMKPRQLTSLNILNRAHSKLPAPLFDLFVKEFHYPEFLFKRNFLPPVLYLFFLGKLPPKYKGKRIPIYLPLLPCSSAHKDLSISALEHYKVLLEISISSYLNSSLTVSDVQLLKNEFISQKNISTTEIINSINKLLIEVNKSKLPASAIIPSVFKQSPFVSNIVKFFSNGHNLDFLLMLASRLNISKPLVAEIQIWKTEQMIKFNPPPSDSNKQTNL